MEKSLKDGDSDSIKEKDQVSCIQKVKGILPALKQVSVEPAGLFLIMSALMNYIMSMSLVLDRACRVNNNFPAEVCDNIKNNIGRGNYTEEENAIQHVVSNAQIYRGLFVNICPLLYVIFLGPWSDKYGRKLPLLLPTIGYVIQCVLLVVFSLIESAGAYWVTLGPTLLTSALGGSSRLFSMAASSHIGDTSAGHVRTVRMGIYRCCSMIGVPLGFALGAALTKSPLSTAMSFVISTCISVAALLVIVFVVKSGAKGEAVNDDTKTAVKSILNPRHAIQVLRVPFKKRANSGRTKIILLLIAYVCILSPLQGEYKIMFLFLRYKLGWDMGDYGAFTSYGSGMMVLGTILSMGILSHRLKLSDPVVGFLSGISQLTSTFIYAFAYTSFMIYLASTVDMMNGTMVVVVKSMLSKLVLDDEQGKIFAVVCILEAVIPYFMDPTYIALYKTTFSKFAGSFYLLSAALSIPPQLIFLLFICRKWYVKTTADCEREEKDNSDIAKENDTMVVALEDNATNDYDKESMIDSSDDKATIEDEEKIIPDSEDLTTMYDKSSESVGLMNGEFKSSKSSLK